MPQGRSGSYRVRIAGQEIVVADLDAVRRLAESGQIGAAAEVRAPGSDTWAPLSEVLQPRPRDPWSAWEDAEEVDPQQIWQQYSGAAPPPLSPEPTPEELPVGALSVEDERRTDPGKDRKGPKFVVEGGRKPAGKVIAFPSRPGLPPPSAQPVTDGNHALAEPVPFRPPQREIPLPPMRTAPAPVAATPPPAATAGFRWGPLLVLLGVGVGALALVRWYVLSQASVRPPPQAPVAEAPVAAPAEPAVEVSGPPRPRGAPDSPYPAMEAELRELLPHDIREVVAEGNLEDALLIELHALGVRVTRVEAPVLRWGGRKQDIPELASVRVYVASDLERLDRDLGAVGLAVGKYIHRYGFEVQSFEVIFEGIAEMPLQRTVDPGVAREFYQGRRSLQEYLKPS